MLKYISKYVSSIFLLLFSLFIMSCNNSGVSEGTTELVIVNNTSTNIKLIVGDYSEVTTNHLGDDFVDVSTTSLGETLDVTTLKSVNIWYLNDSQTILTRLTESDLTTPRDFLFDENRTYVLTLTDVAFSLVDDLGVTIGVDNSSYGGSNDEPDDEPQETYEYKVTTVSRNPAVEGNEESMDAAMLTPVSATISEEVNAYGTTYIHVTAAFRFDGTIDDPENISFVQARFYLNDENGNNLYNSTQDGGDGFKYCYSNYVSRYYSDGYNYGNYYVFPGDYIYLSWYEYYYSEDTDNPLYNFDINSVDAINFDLIAEDFSSLNHEKLGITDGIEETSQVITSNSVTSVLTNLSSETWYQLQTYNLDYILFNSNNEILGRVSASVVGDDTYLVAPNASITVDTDLPYYFENMVDHAVLMLAYDEGIPLNASVRSISTENLNREEVTERDNLRDLEELSQNY